MRKRLAIAVLGSLLLAGNLALWGCGKSEPLTSSTPPATQASAPTNFVLSITRNDFRDYTCMNGTAAHNFPKGSPTTITLTGNITGPGGNWQTLCAVNTTRYITCDPVQGGVRDDNVVSWSPKTFIGGAGASATLHADFDMRWFKCGSAQPDCVVLDGKGDIVAGLFGAVITTGEECSRPEPSPSPSPTPGASCTLSSHEVKEILSARTATTVTYNVATVYNSPGQGVLRVQGQPDIPTASGVPAVVVLQRQTLMVDVPYTWDAPGNPACHREGTLQVIELQPPSYTCAVDKFDYVTLDTQPTYVLFDLYVEFTTTQPGALAQASFQGDPIAPVPSNFQTLTAHHYQIKYARGTARQDWPYSWNLPPNCHREGTSYVPAQ